MLFVQRQWHGFFSPFVHWTPPNGKCPDVGQNKINSTKKYDPRVVATSSYWWWQPYAMTQFAIALVISLYFMLIGTDVFQDLQVVKDSGLSDWVVEATVGTMAFVTALWVLVGVGNALDLGAFQLDPLERVEMPNRLARNEIVRHLVFAAVGVMLILMQNENGSGGDKKHLLNTIEHNEYFK